MLGSGSDAPRRGVSKPSTPAAGPELADRLPRLHQARRVRGGWRVVELELLLIVLLVWELRLGQVVVVVPVVVVILCRDGDRTRRF